jgi:DNA-binding winged helix-turn-helix (wHTH) protein
MSNEVLEFGGFRLEPAERRLSRDGAVVEVSGRYLDALLLLAGRPGELVTKERFMAEVWRGIPVTDEALTQCIRTLRKALGDEAGRPRFIATVPRHGYRFVVEVTTAGGAQVEDEASAFPDGSFGGGSSDQVQPAITSHDKSGDASSGGGLPASSSPERAAASHLNVESGFKSRELLA